MDFRVAKPDEMVNNESRIVIMLKSNMVCFGATSWDTKGRNAS
jgi:hypothetical protein